MKLKEYRMGRQAHTSCSTFFGYPTLHHYQRRRGIAGLEAITEHAMLRLEAEGQAALLAASNNFPGPLGPLASTVMKLGCFPLGNLTRPYSEPSDVLTKEVSRLLTTPSELRNFFAEGIYSAPVGQGHQITDLMNALPVCVEADKIASTIRREGNRKPTESEAETLARAEALRDVLIQVDVFEKLGIGANEEGYQSSALVGTEERLASMERKTFAA